MTIIRFLKRQNWWYATICIVSLYLFIYFSHSYLAISFLFAGIFLISYGLKFAGKYNNEWIDLTKLIYYFLFLTGYILGHELEEIGFIAVYSFPFMIVYLYGYSLLNFYQNEMEQKDRKIKTSVWLIVQVIQTVLTLIILVWAITQKVEADKQKDHAYAAEMEAVRQKEIATFKDKLSKESELRSLHSRRELEEYKALYQESLLNKK